MEVYEVKQSLSNAIAKMKSLGDSLWHPFSRNKTKRIRRQTKWSRFLERSETSSTHNQRI